jgi:uncharacterized cupin superfamily protein
MSVVSGEAVLEVMPGVKRSIREGDTLTFTVGEDGSAHVTQTPEHVPTFVNHWATDEEPT